MTATAGPRDKVGRMRLRTGVGLLLVLAGGGFGVQGQSGPTQAKTPVEWFRRADALTNLRMPGAGPFHMKVTFHAYPGMDFAKKGKSEIITGDGTYEEWWLSPEQWRREVTLGSYHAVEVRGGGARRMQASATYEPTRVLMFLDALYNPIPRNLISPELIDKHAGWKIAHLTAGGLHYVRISSVTALDANSGLKHEYDFVPSGIVIRNEESDAISTTWQNFVPFAGKIVPRHFMAGAMGRTLIDAQVSTEPLASAPPLSLFTLPGDPASPGETLRPLHSYEVHYGAQLHSTTWGSTGDSFQGTVSGVMDRSGVPRELEVVAAQDTAQADVFLRNFSEFRWAPSTIDGSPCEVIIRFYTLRTPH